LAKHAKNADDIYQYALMGARARLSELKAEIDSIYRRFPALVDGRMPVEGSAAAAPSRRPPTWTPEARREVSVRMKKYWAARRRQKKVVQRST
jgi:hypothetical protein